MRCITTPNLIPLFTRKPVEGLQPSNPTAHNIEHVTDYNSYTKQYTRNNSCNIHSQTNTDII